jgi:hypothetical protein
MACAASIVDDATETIGPNRGGRFLIGESERAASVDLYRERRHRHDTSKAALWITGNGTDDVDVRTGIRYN